MKTETSDSLFDVLDGLDFSNRASPAQQNYVSYLRSLARDDNVVSELPVCLSANEASQEIGRLLDRLTRLPARASQLAQLDQYGVFRKNPNLRNELTCRDALRLLREIRKRKTDPSSSPNSSQEPF